jgi:hypothetical protein
MQPDAQGVADALPAHSYDAPDRQRCAVDDLTRIQAEDVVIERVVRGDQVQPTIELELLLACWRAAIEPDDDDLWR